MRPSRSPVSLPTEGAEAFRDTAGDNRIASHAATIGCHGHARVAMLFYEVEHAHASVSMPPLSTKKTNRKSQTIAKAQASMAETDSARRL